MRFQSSYELVHRNFIIVVLITVFREGFNIVKARIQLKFVFKKFLHFFFGHKIIFISTKAIKSTYHLLSKHINKAIINPPKNPNTKNIIFNIIGRLAAWIDKNIVDGLMNLIANLTALFSDEIKGLQSGKLQQYASYFFAGVIGFMLLFIYVFYWLLVWVNVCVFV